MMLSLALVVLGCSIAVFFSDELVALARRLGTVPGVKLFAPLIIASWLIEKYQYWGYWFLVQFRAVSDKLIKRMAHLVPIQDGLWSFGQVLYIFMLASLPACIFWIMAKQKGISDKGSRPLSYKIGIGLWVLAVFLMLSQM